jgi:hypothetical protein
MMKKIRLFATLATLMMGACGGNPPNQSDTSVTPAPDSGTPAPDAGQSDTSPPVDAAVDNDVPVVPVDSPSPEDVQTAPDAEMNIPGIGPVIMTGAFQCASRLCRQQVVTGSTEPCRVTCNSAMTRAELSAIGFSAGNGWADCRGNNCSMPIGPSLIRAIIYPITSDGCAACGTIVDINTNTGAVVPWTNGVVYQSCPL